MNQHDIAKMQAELTVSGAQLLHNSGMRVDTKEAQQILSIWARTHAEVILRRIRIAK